MHDIYKSPHDSHRVIRLDGKGRTFICGDLHGCHEEFMQKLVSAGFDRLHDRVIALGDIVDRGMDSLSCLRLLREPWFHSLMGNHEEMMVNALPGGRDRYSWYFNGGDWYSHLDSDGKEEVSCLCDEYVMKLPASMTLLWPDGSGVGLVHGDAPDDWHQAVDGSQMRMEALWGRARIRYHDSTRVENIDLVLCGHAPGDQIRKLGNVFYLDTGAGYENGRLTLIEVGNSKNALLANIKAQRDADKAANHLPIFPTPARPFGIKDDEEDET